MNGGYLQALLFLMNRPEPIRQASLLMVLASGMEDASAMLSGLTALSNESSPPWSGKINQLRRLLEEGHSLSDALKTARGLVPDESMVAIRMAEEAGVVRQILAEEAERLLNDSGNAAPAGATLPSLLIWVLGVGCTIVFVLSFITTFIVPKFRQIFISFDAQLPAATEALINGSDATYFFVLPALSCGAIAVWVLLKSALSQLSSGHVVLSQHLPRYWTPVVLRTLSLAAATENSVEAGLHCILREMHPGRAATRLSAARVRAAAGYDSWESLRKFGFLKEREVAFLQNAEESKHLDWGLRHLALTIERQRYDFTRRLFNFAHPILILGVGCVVFFVCLAFFLPLVKLINDLS